MTKSEPDRSILSLSLSELCARLQAREFSCEHLCRFYLGRIRKYGSGNALNCVSEVNPQALEEARVLDLRGPDGLSLYGLCVLIKDNIDVAGMATTAGSVLLKENIADTDSPFVQTLRKNGAVVLGKTNMTEFANFLTQGMPGGFSSLGHQVLNAYDSTHTPSGSSSGSAVAMSARLCSFAVGTDTSFSVVGCASENGVVGFKPSIGTISTEGVIPITAAFDEIGFFTRDMKDMRFLADRLMFQSASEMNGSQGDPELRKVLSVWTVNREHVSQNQLRRYETLFDHLKADGWTFIEQPGRNTTRLKELMLRRFSSELREYLKTHRGSAAGKLTPESILEKYREAPETLAPYGTGYLEESLSYERDPDNTRAVSEIRSDMLQERARLTEELSFSDACVMTGPTCIMHYAGLPSLSLPFTMDPENGIPRSILLFGWDMKTLLSAGAEIERHGDEIPLPKLEKKQI